MRLPTARWRLAPLALTGLAAGIVALLLFYSAYAYLPAENRVVAQQLAAQGLTCPPGRPLAEKLIGTLGLGLGPQGAIAPLLALAAVAGALGMRHRRIGIMLAAAGIGGILSFATLLGSDQPVRWAHFLYPALCIGAGPALAAWWRRGRAGGWLALALLGGVLWSGGAQWIGQIAEYLH